MGFIRDLFRQKRKAARRPATSAGARFKIRITTADGEVLYWHKRGRLHTVEEDVADTFVAGFKAELFAARADGSLSPHAPGTKSIARVEKEPA